MKLHLISGGLRQRVVCPWVSNRILVDLESWHTLCVLLFFLVQMRPLKQGCKGSQSEHYSAEVSLPKNWVNEKPKSLIELNTLSFAAVLQSLPPTSHSAFIFLSRLPPALCLISFFFFWQLCKLLWWNRSMFIICFSPNSSAVNLQRSVSWLHMGWGRDLQLTSLITWLKQLVSTSAMRTWTPKLIGQIYNSIFC